MLPVRRRKGGVTQCGWPRESGAVFRPNGALAHNGRAGRSSSAHAAVARGPVLRRSDLVRTGRLALAVATTVTSSAVGACTSRSSVRGHHAATCRSSVVAAAAPVACGYASADVGSHSLRTPLDASPVGVHDGGGALLPAHDGEASGRGAQGGAKAFPRLLADEAIFSGYMRRLFGLHCAPCLLFMCKR